LHLKQQSIFSHCPNLSWPAADAGLRALAQGTAITVTIHPAASQHILITKHHTKQYACCSLLTIVSNKLASLSVPQAPACPALHQHHAWLRHHALNLLLCSSIWLPPTLNLLSLSCALAFVMLCCHGIVCMPEYCVPYAISNVQTIMLSNFLCFLVLRDMSRC
jgi:hypothetical protein